MFLDPDKKSLGPLKDLDGLIDEVLALDSAKPATGDLNKSAALATFKKKSEKKVSFSSIILEIQLQIGIKNCMI